MQRADVSNTGPHAVIIGAGISGLAASAVLAQQGFRVTVLDRNTTAGGRARTWEQDGFLFDLGPSFYWMPDVFERFFRRFGTTVADHYELRRLDPSYTVIFGAHDQWAVPSGQQAVARLFEQEEPGAGGKLATFLAEAALKYRLGMEDIVHAPSLGWHEYLRPELVSAWLHSAVFRSLRSDVRRRFRSHRIRQVLEFPMLFLGAAPEDTPALFSLMNHSDIGLGTWYPMGGMGKVLAGVRQVAEQHGAAIRLSEPVRKIMVKDGKAVGVETDGGVLTADVVLATADYHHAETDLLPQAYRTYTDGYWRQRHMAPSALLFFLGLGTPLPAAGHHTLFFDEDLDAHTADIFRHGRWPQKPLFHVSCTSATDPSTAPPGCTNMVILVPIASGSADDEATREHYFALVADRIKRTWGIDIRRDIRVKRSYCTSDFLADYNAFRGNAYGLAATLRQLGPGRPRMKSRKVRGLYFAGQLSVPGPGLPPALISGQTAAALILQEDPWV